jgi:ribonuclease VapC
VLDASALLALLNGEPGNKVVAENLPGAVISAVNLSEVVAKLGEAGMPNDVVRSALEDLGVELRAFDSEAAYLTGALRAQTRKLGLSLGDRACVALGFQLSFPVLTADRNWKELDVGVEVRTIR